ncbi:hypothetical protein HPB50_003427 [Hyalomma asiaticum]|uniref:Uncharacterized protein n=1 Tax=Hyalomma asiaticum TaxID=266040 RepID=A0ACB7RJQ5_HYAAI|nr:hypothetical protein HPB50_003427 [Hyalomma asiaticum]
MADKAASKSPSPSQRSPSPAPGRGGASKRPDSSPPKKATPSKSPSSPRRSRSSSPSPAKDVVRSPSAHRRRTRSPSPRSPSQSPRATVNGIGKSPSTNKFARRFRTRLNAAIQRDHERRSSRLYRWLKSLSRRNPKPRKGGSPRLSRRTASRRSPDSTSPYRSGSVRRSHPGSPSRSRHDRIPFGTLYGFPCLTLVVIVVVVAAFIVATARYLRRPGASAVHHCRSETCYRYEELLASAMDPEAPPCDNFYAHVCGTWIKTGKKPVYEVNWDRFLVEIAKRTADLSPHSGSNQEPVDKAVTYIKACLSPLERDNMHEVRAALAAAGIVWPRRDTKPDFLSSIFYMSRRIYQPVFLAIDVANMEGPQTLILSIGGQFMSTYDRISQHVTTIHAKEHFRVTYDSLAPMNESRLDELFEHFIAMKRFLDNHLPVTDDGKSSADPTHFVRWTPSVPESRWDYQTRHFLGSPLRNLTGCFVDRVGGFKALFELHKAFGEEKMANFVGFFAVQTLVGFANIRLLESFYAASDVAIEEQRKACVMTAYQTFAYVIDSFLQKGTDGALEDLNMLVDWVAAAFGRLLRSADNSSAIEGDPMPEPLHSNINNAFSILSACRRPVADSIYAAFPEMVIDAPLRNSINVSSYMQARVQMVSTSEETSQRPYAGYQALDATVFSGFRVNPQLLAFPWYEPDAHVGILLGGLGARLAAATFYDYVERHNGTDSPVYAENQRCLSPVNATSREGAIRDVDFDLQGAVAAAAVIADVYKEVVRKDDPAWTRREPPQPWTDESVAFVFMCWLSCGDAERGPLMCNTPAMHSRDFGRIFGCPAGSLMNPVKKCQMKV